jgi:PRTRC genetic system protein C
MTTQETTYTRRIFRYGDKTFPDPGSEYSPEQVLNHLKTYLPELGHAKTEEKLLEDGTLEITFSKQVTRKGAMLRETLL